MPQIDVPNCTIVTRTGTLDSLRYTIVVLGFLYPQLPPGLNIERYPKPMETTAPGKDGKSPDMSIPGTKRRQQETHEETEDVSQQSTIIDSSAARPPRRRRIDTLSESEMEDLQERARQWTSSSEAQERRRLALEVDALASWLRKSRTKRWELECRNAYMIEEFGLRQEVALPWIRDMEKADMDGDVIHSDELGRFFRTWEIRRMKISKLYKWMTKLRGCEREVRSQIHAKEARMHALRKEAPISPIEEGLLRASGQEDLLEGPSVDFEEPQPIDAEFLENDVTKPPASIESSTSLWLSKGALNCYKYLVETKSRLDRLKESKWLRHGRITSCSSMDVSPPEDEDLRYESWHLAASSRASEPGQDVEDISTFLESNYSTLVKDLHQKMSKLRQRAWKNYGMFTDSSGMVVLLEDVDVDLPPLEPVWDQPPHGFVPLPEEKMQVNPEWEYCLNRFPLSAGPNLHHLPSDASSSSFS